MIIDSSNGVLRCLAAVAMLLGTLACASTREVIQSMQAGEGTEAVYPVTRKQAQQIGATVFRWEGAEMIEDHSKEGYLLATVGSSVFGPSFVSYGTSMGVWFERVSDRKTKVTVVTKRRWQYNLTTDLTEKTYHRRFAQAVGIVASGEKLPESAPD